jgi:glucarate dehydratase
MTSPQSSRPISADVRISSVDVTTVAIPMSGRLHHSDGETPPWQVRHVVQLHTDAGVTGLGDASPRVSAEMIRKAVTGLIGEDPFNLERIQLQLGSVKFYRMDLANIAAAVQIACLDIQGQCIGRPVADLLGGRLRDRVPVIAYIYRKTGANGHPSALDSAGVVEQTRQRVEKYGCRTIKYKAGAVPPEQDIETARALREAFGEHKLRVDPNGAWEVATAINVFRKLDELDLEWAEDPTFGIEGMAEFARRTSIPTATNMCCIQPRELPATVAAKAVDVVLLDEWYLGGPWSARQMAISCRTFGLGLGIHAGGGSAETGIGLAAEAHLGLSLPGLVHAMDTMHHELLDDIVELPGWRYENGDLVVPQHPGLGVELDGDKLAKYAEHYQALADSGTPAAAHPAYPKY